MSYREDLTEALRAVEALGCVSGNGAQRAAVATAVGKWVTADAELPLPPLVPEPDTDPTWRPRLAAVPLSAASAALVGTDELDVGALPPADAAVVDVLTAVTDGDGVPLLEVALGAFHAATAYPPGSEWGIWTGDDRFGHCVDQLQRLTGAHDEDEGSQTDQEWDSSLTGPSGDDLMSRDELLVSSLPWVTVPEGVHVPMGGAPLRASDDLLWPPSVAISNEEEMGSDAGGAGGLLDGAHEEALYVTPPTTIIAVLWPRVWADEVWAQGGLWAALARVRAMVSTPAAAGSPQLPAVVSILQTAVANAARPGYGVGDVPSMAVAPILRLATAVNDSQTAMAVLRRLTLPPPPGIADAPGDPPRAPRGLRFIHEAAAVAGLARWWGCNACREELAVLHKVVAEGGPASLVAVRWLAAELSRERYQAFPDGAVGALAAGVTAAVQIHCVTAARFDVPTAVAAVKAAFFPSSQVTDMAERFCSSMNGNISMVTPQASLALAAMGRLAVCDLVKVSPSMLPDITRLFTHLLSLGDCITLLSLYEKLSCRQEAIALQMLVAVLTDPGVLAAGTHRWQSSNRDEASSAFRPIAAAFVERATRVAARLPLPAFCIPAALPPREATAVPVPGAGLSTFLRGPSVEHTVGPFPGGLNAAIAWVDALLSGAGAAIGGYDVTAVPVTLVDGVCVVVTKNKGKTIERAAASHAALVAAISHLQSMLRGVVGAAAPNADTPRSDACAIGAGTQNAQDPSTVSPSFSPVHRARCSKSDAAAINGHAYNDKDCTPLKRAAEGKNLELSQRDSKRSRHR